jgi:hypothetical protein
MTTRINNYLIDSPREKVASKCTLIAKFILVAIVVAALFAGVIFTGGMFLNLLAAGAPIWKVGLVAAGCAASGLSILGASYFSAKHKMFQDTNHNFKDAVRFTADTLCSPIFFADKCLSVIKEVIGWNLIVKD